MQPDARWPHGEQGCIDTAPHDATDGEDVSHELHAGSCGNCALGGSLHMHIYLCMGEQWMHGDMLGNRVLLDCNLLCAFLWIVHA